MEINYREETINHGAECRQIVREGLWSAENNTSAS